MNSAAGTVVSMRSASTLSARRPWRLDRREDHVAAAPALADVLHRLVGAALLGERPPRRDRHVGPARRQGRGDRRTDPVVRAGDERHGPVGSDGHGDASSRRVRPSGSVDGIAGHGHVRHVQGAARRGHLRHAQPVGRRLGQAAGRRWGSRRWRPPARASPGRSARRTSRSPSRSCCPTSRRWSRRWTCRSTSTPSGATPPTQRASARTVHLLALAAGGGLLDRGLRPGHRARSTRSTSRPSGVAVAAASRAACAGASCSPAAGGEPPLRRRAISTTPSPGCTPTATRAPRCCTHPDWSTSTRSRLWSARRRTTGERAQAAVGAGRGDAGVGRRAPRVDRRRARPHGLLGDESDGEAGDQRRPPQPCPLLFGEVRACGHLADATHSGAAPATIAA